MITNEALYELVNRLRNIGKDTQSIEVKSSVGKLPATITETLSAFANGSGGRILLGLSEEDGFRPAHGFEAHRIADSLADVCSKKMTPPLRPIIEILPFEGSLVLIVEVDEIMPRDKPCYITERGTYKGSYIRVADGDRRLSNYEIDRLLEERSQPKYDIETVVEATIDDLDKTLLTNLLARQRELHPRVFANLPDIEALKSLRVIASSEDGNDCPTLAGLLAIGSYPQKYFPRLTVTFTAFEGVDKAGTGKVKYLDSQTMAGSIPVVLEDTLSAVRRNIRVGGSLNNGFRVDVPDYPLDAVREAVTNALMHRDYSVHSRGTQVQVNLFSDRLEVISPGGLYGTVTVDTLGTIGISSTRNQHLSNLLETTPYGDRGFVAENRGTGFQLIEALLAASGLPPATVADRPAFFSLTFSRQTKAKEFGSKNDDRIIAFLLEKGEASAAEIESILMLPRRTVNYKLGQLLSSGAVKSDQPRNSPNRKYRLGNNH